MPGRKFSASNSSYRYGFNGKENDKAISEGSQDYGLRIYDGRLSRFLSNDPLASNYPYYSPYQYASNSPVELIDIDGAEGGKLLESLNNVGQWFKEVFTFSDQKEEIKEGLTNISTGVNKQIVGPWNAWKYAQAENPDLEIALNKTDGLIQSTTGVVQVASGVQAAGAKVETIVSVPVILKNLSKPVLKNVSTEVVEEAVSIKRILPPEPAAAPAKKPYNMADNVPEWGSSKPAAPTEAYDRLKHYGYTPTKTDRKVLGAKANEVVDHTTPLVQHYYEGDGSSGSLPGYLMTVEQRREFAKARANMQLQPSKDSQKQGAAMSKYSKQQKKKNGL